MGKFDLENEEITIPKKNYKEDVNKEILNKFNEDIEFKGINLFDIDKEEKSKKSQLTIYFDDEDLVLLKAVAQVKNSTLNKIVKSIIKANLRVTKDSIPKDLDVVKFAKEYDKKNRNRGRKK